MGEHLLCKQGVVGSIPISSTKTAAERKVGSRETSGEFGTTLEFSVGLRDREASLTIEYGL
jgi:hypothetical protein